MKNIYFYSVSMALIGLLLSACVTINIYFPAAAAEEAADKIIQRVMQLENEENNERVDESVAE